MHSLNAPLRILMRSPCQKDGGTWPREYAAESLVDAQAADMRGIQVVKAVIAIALEG